MVACSRQIRFSVCFDLLLLHARFILSLGKIITFVMYFDNKCYNNTIIKEQCAEWTFNIVVFHAVFLLLNSL